MQRAEIRSLRPRKVHNLFTKNLLTNQIKYDII